MCISEIIFVVEVPINNKQIHFTLNDKMFKIISFMSCNLWLLYVLLLKRDYSVVVLNLKSETTTIIRLTRIFHN